MRAPLTSELLGRAGAYECLAELGRRPFALSRPEVVEFLREYCEDQGDHLLLALRDSGIVTEVGRECGLTTAGIRAHLLLEAINGGDLSEVVRRLRGIDPRLRMYDLVTAGMTGTFVHSLYSQPDFRRVYICSPWIHLRKKAFRRLMQALFKADSAGSPRAEILVITRPVNGNDPRQAALYETLLGLAKLGADIVFHSHLHAKLYIREPVARGGLSMAILGSENLTIQKWIELGVRITNDSEMIGKLVRYYFDLYQQCHPFKEGNP